MNLRPQIQIQPISNKHLTRLAELMLQLSLYYDKLDGRTLKEGSPKYTIKQHKKLKSAKTYIKNKTVWGAFHANQLIAYISIRFFDFPHHSIPVSIFISELYVVPQYRQQSIGKNLIQYILKIPFPAKYKYFSVTHSPSEPWLTKYYGNLGFQLYKKLKSRNIALIRPRNITTLRP